MLEALALCAAHQSEAELKQLQEVVGIIYNPNGVLFDRDVVRHIAFPNCVYWDWMHNWCSSGGIGQYHLNEFVQLIAATLQMQMSDFDEFAKKVVLPRTTPRLHKTFFADRIVNGSGRHMRAFAAEVLRPCTFSPCSCN